MSEQDELALALSEAGWRLTRYHPERVGLGFGACHDASGAMQHAATPAELLRRVKSWNDEPGRNAA